MESPGKEDVDSALCAGMRDPRERTALFRLEHLYQDFCNSSSLWMEVGGAYNRCVVMGPPNGELETTVSVQQQQAASGHQTSFHRLLVHRLADRFGIKRESRSCNTIRLYKCPETRVPPVLLQDLDPAVYYPSTEMANGSNQNSSSTPPSPLDAKEPSASAEKQLKKKIIVKKRSPGQNMVLQKKSLTTQQSRNTDSSDHKNRSSDYISSRSSSSEQLEAKERAYAEARARIFKDDDANPDETTTDPSTPDEDATLSMEKLTVQTNENETLHSPYPDLSPDDSKAVYRNRAEEAADPDFQRGRIRASVVMGPIPSVPYNPAYVYPNVAGYHSPLNTGSLTASAPAFVPGSANPYLPPPTPSQQPQLPWAASPQKNQPVRYDPQRAWWPQPYGAPLSSSSPTQARKQNQTKRPNSFATQENNGTATGTPRGMTSPTTANPNQTASATIGLWPSL